jgi:hypothetical protein
VAAELVGYWSFDGETADDLSGFDNHGQIVNFPEFNTDTPNGGGYSISFLGDGGRVDVPHSDSLDLADTMTIAFWIKADNDDQGDAAWNGPMNKAAGEPRIGWEFQRFDASSRLDMRVDTDEAENSVFGNLTGTFDDIWTHVAWTVDQGNWESYLDGEFVSSGTYPHGSGFANDAANLVFGCRAGNWCAFVGSLDEIALWDEVLPAEEISELAGGATPIGDTVPVGGEGTIGLRMLTGQRVNSVFGPPSNEVRSGLLQEWYSAGNPGNKADIDAVFDTQEPIVPPFNSGHGETWWTGTSTMLEGLVQYPDEVRPVLNGVDNDNYMTRLTGEILVPESGPYRFTDGVDDYTYLAIDLDQSGVAGDDFDEVLIDDNAWTSVLRADNSGGQGYADIDIDVAEGGEWLAIEFNMAEGGGGDSGVLYWDYDPNAPAGQRLGGVVGFPEFSEDPFFDQIDAAEAYIPNTHLRAAGAQELESADLEAEIITNRPIEFDVNGDTYESDQLVVVNPNPEVYTTILDVDGVPFQITATGAVADGDAFTILRADQIVGTPVITSSVPGQNWVFNPATGQVSLGGAPRGPLQAGDANMDLRFDQLDLVAVQIAAKYLTGESATWGEGDWDAAPGGSIGNPPQGNGQFDQIDIIMALSNGLYLQGPYVALAGPAPDDGATDEQTSIVYDPATGGLAVNAPASTELTSINIDSAAGIFTGEPAENLEGSFDNDADDNVFKATFGGSFGSISFGNVAQAGLSEEFLLNDLTVVGSLAGGGDLGAVDLIYVPEPSGLLLLCLALPAALMTRRRRGEPR